MARTLPPLTALRAFEAAARHLSFTKAAAELSVTPAAISHQVKTLEDWLELPLFHRQTRALQLTDTGLAALPSLEQGFDKLAESVERMRNHHKGTGLTLSVSPSFGSMWLMPRLEHFRKRHPDIEIRIDGTESLADLARDNVDVAVRYGPGGYKGVKIDYLFNQVNTPVCSPALMNGKHPLIKPDDLRHHSLLHVEWKDADASWKNWLQAAGLPDIDTTLGSRFTMEHMAVQAAVDGQGVALIGDILIADEIAAGRLVSPFKRGLSTPLNNSYHLLIAQNRSERPELTAFRDWVLEEASVSRRLQGNIREIEPV